MRSIIQLAEDIAETKRYLGKPLQPAINRLERLIDIADDKGLASALYYRRWLSYADAKQLLVHLRRRSPNPAPADS